MFALTSSGHLHLATTLPANVSFWDFAVQLDSSVGGDVADGVYTRVETLIARRFATAGTLIFGKARSSDGTGAPQSLFIVDFDSLFGIQPSPNGDFAVNIRIRTAALVAFAVIGATAAHAAAPGYTTADVNIRTGPDIEFPVIDVIPEGDDIYVEGCLRDESWCDVRWDGFRGWVYSEYLAVDYRGDTVLLVDAGPSVLHIPFISFTVGDYWRRHYVNRPWYQNRDRWFSYKARPRAGWRAPPSGSRKRGWWRSDYRVPRGMKAAPARDWKRPNRNERRRDVRPGGNRDGARRNDRNEGRVDGRRGNDRGNAQPGGGRREVGRGGENRRVGERGGENRGDAGRGGEKRRDGKRGGENRGDAGRGEEKRGGDRRTGDQK